MKKIQPGGALLLKNGETKSSIFGNIKQLVPFGSGSIGGYIFKGELINPYISLYGGTPNIIFPTYDVLIKLVQIQHSNESHITQHNNKEVIPAKTFNKEVMIQNDVFKKSIDSFLEPICPNIIYSDIITSVSFPNCNNSNLITDIMVPNRYYGIIIMEIIQGAKTVSTLFPLITKTNPNFDEINVSHDQDVVLKNYLYQILRLKKIGYTHNDAHLFNGLYVVNYDYIGKMRVFLIDFGRTTANNGYEFDDIVPSTYLSHDCLRQFTQVLVKKFNLNNFNSLYDFFDNEIKTSRDTYFVKLYDSSIINDLRNYTGYIVSVSEQYKMLSQFKNSYIFVKQNAMLMDISQLYTVPFQKLNINYGTDKFCSSQEYTVSGQAYDVNLPIQLIKPGINTYVDDELRNIDRDHHQIYLWVIGSTQYGNIKLYVIKAESCYEIGTKHFYIVEGYKITKFYAAGEMVVSNYNVLINFESGTYMYPLINNWKKQETENTIYKILHNTVPRFILYTLNNHLGDSMKFNDVTIDNTGTFFNPNYCCLPSTLRTTDVFLESLHHIMPDIVKKKTKKTHTTKGGNKTTERIDSPIKSRLKEKTKLLDNWKKYIETQKQHDYEMFEKMYPSYRVQYSQDLYPNMEIIVDKLEENNTAFMEGLCIINKYVEALKQTEIGINKEKQLNSNTRGKTVRQTEISINKEKQLMGFNSTTRRRTARQRNIQTKYTQKNHSKIKKNKDINNINQGWMEQSNVKIPII